MLGIQIAGILFGLLMVYISFLNMKRKELQPKESIFWIIAWLVFILLVVFPNSIDMIAKKVLNISRTLDFLIIMGFIFLIGVSFQNYLLARRNQNKLEEIVRKLALRNKKV